MTTLHNSLLEKPSELKGASEAAQPASVGRPHSSSSEHASGHPHNHLLQYPTSDYPEPTSAVLSPFSAALASSGPNSLGPESLSSASSFQSLASTLSSKSSSGICADSAPGSPDKADHFDNSYVNVDIPDLDDLISACAGINLNACDVTPVPDTDTIVRDDDSQDGSSGAADLSQDQTFASAADETLADDSQIRLHLEETIQTFNTCPSLEAIQVTKVVSSSTSVFKVPLPVDEHQLSSSSSVIPYLSFEESVLRKHQTDHHQSSSTSSVIPYLSFEESVLRRYQTEDASDAGAEFKSALDTFHLPIATSTRGISPTPCVEIDVVEAAAAAAAAVAKAQQDRTVSSSTPADEQREQQNVSEGDSTNVSFEEVQSFNSTILLRTESKIAELSAASTEIPEKLNVTVSKSEVIFDSSPLPTKPLEKEETVAQVEKEAVAPNKVDIIVQKEIETPKESECVQEANIPRETEVTLQESNILNKTEYIVQEINNTLNKRQDIIQEESILNKTQDIIEKETVINCTQDIIKENSLNNTQDIIGDEINLNKTQDITQDKNNLNKTEVIVQDIKTPNQSQVITQEEYALNKSEVIAQAINKTELIVQNESHNLRKVEIVTEKVVDTPKNSSEVFIEEAVNLKSVSEEVSNINKKEIVEEQKNKVLIQETKSPNKSEISVQNEKVTPNKSEALDRKEVKTPNRSENFTEDSQNSNLLNADVISSTPLPSKNFNRGQTQRSPKTKSTLFTEEPKSPKSQSPQVPVQSLNTLQKNETSKEEKNRINLDETVAVNKTLEKTSFVSSELITEDNIEATNIIHDSISLHRPQEPEYEAFKPQQQSTTLAFPDFRALQEAALSVAKDIDASLEIEESEQFVSANTELFTDPSAFDFLTRIGSQPSRRGDRYDSLFMKFDPLAQRQSMLPQKNLPTSPSVDEEEGKETKADTPLTNMGTPKKNPALAAIDRLLFYSPCTPPTSTETEVAEAKQKKEEAEKQEPQLVTVVDEKMAKELELVRSTVLQLEAELEKQKQEHKEQLERQKAAFEEKVSHMQTKFSQMQSQLTQEVKCKDQMTVVVEEYEKSISRLIAEREKDRTSFTAEKAKLQEELQVANQHLSNTEAAFSDVHTKYERLKNVVSAYRSNETVLKESIAENQETIKTLENRYEQLKSHAMAQLEKANLELNAIRKHNEAETVKLKALVRKAELKSKSLEETVEQKMKENKELTQIIDEMIARVD